VQTSNIQIAGREATHNKQGSDSEHQSSFGSHAITCFPVHMKQADLHKVLRVAVPSAGLGLMPLVTCVLNADGASFPAEVPATARGRTAPEDKVIIILTTLDLLKVVRWARRLERFPTAIQIIQDDSEKIDVVYLHKV
jgi:hypothetical protein